jgi:hypothetical protein
MGVGRENFTKEPQNQPSKNKLYTGHKTKTKSWPMYQKLSFPTPVSLFNAPKI